ncbi:MAG: insulinase family protein, partial [Clostridiales bacterium]|nr:insulinase family protein [Clostridiales bacterium]
TSYITEKMDITQGKLCMGIRTKTDYYALLTANEIFGGGANSRLFMKAREEKSLCYYISSNVVRCNGAVIVQSGISSENVRRVNDIISEELKNFEKVTEKEIENAKESIIKRYTAAEDNLSTLSDFCLSGAIYNGAASPREAAKKIKAADSDEIRNAFADAYIDTVYFLKEGRKADENIF